MTDTDLTECFVPCGYEHYNIVQGNFIEFDPDCDSCTFASMQASYRKGRREAMEECASLVERGCLPECDSIAHHDNCPYVYPGNAIRVLIEREEKS